ncbi:MAG: hypothetical protein QOD77_164 [Thermoplasmata archaeon]|nr:hypothetical protein [Thermoplasmata archaeon]
MDGGRLAVLGRGGQGAVHQPVDGRVAGAGRDQAHVGRLGQDRLEDDGGGEGGNHAGTTVKLAP